MNYGGINTSDAKTTAQKQSKESDEAESPLLEEETGLAKTKIKTAKNLHAGTQLMLLVFIVVGAICIMAILVVGVINFLLPEGCRWLEAERLNEIRGIFTGVVATVATSAGIGKTLKKD